MFISSNILKNKMITKIMRLSFLVCRNQTVFASQIVYILGQIPKITKYCKYCMEWCNIRLLFEFLNKFQSEGVCFARIADWVDVWIYNGGSVNRLSYSIKRVEIHLHCIISSIILRVCTLKTCYFINSTESMGIWLP